MKTAFLIITISSLLSGCAALVPATPNEPKAGPTTAQPPQATADGGMTPILTTRPARTGTRPGASPSNDSLPTAMLTDELLFKLLTAEIAFQRGDWQNAYTAQLRAAQQTRDPRLARRAAEIALSAKQAGEALNAVRLWRELAPDSAEASQYYVGFMLLSDNLEEARVILAQRLAEARPQARPALILQTQRLLANAKNKESAFNLLDTLVAPYADLPESHIALALSAFNRGDMKRADLEARAALALKPDAEIAILTLAQVTPDKTEVARVLSQFLAANPQSVEVRTAYARTLIEQKNYEGAQTQFKQLLATQPANLTSLYALGMLGVQTNQLPEAEKYLTSYVKALAAKGDDERDPSQALLLLAQIVEERGDSAGALKWLAQIESGDALVGAQIKRAQIVAKQGNLAEGRRLLQETAARSEADKIRVVLSEAQMLREANQENIAFSVLDDALKQFPDNTDLLYDYAMIAEKNNNFLLMEKSLRRVIELAPDNQNAYNALGYSFAERNIRLQEAYVLIEKARAIAPEDPFIMDSMGWVQYRMGKLKEAEELLRRAYAIRADPEIAVHLGEVLWVRGQRDDAQKFWRDARTKDPKNDTLRSTLLRLRASL
ncbi:MAG: tetratricopeptide repeat protein [Pseudomonadota bacterium]